MNNNQPPQMTNAEVRQLGQSYARFHFLRNATIKQPKDEAELRGLTEYMATTFIDHASEFIGCYVAVKSEYEPLLNIFAQIVNRVSNIRAAQAAQQQAAEAAESAPANVSPLIQ